MATEDLEISAMSQVSSALADLDDDARARVLDWAAKRYDVTLAPARRVDSRRSVEGEDGEGDGNDVASAEFSVFADLFDGAGPRTEHDRALVGGYWFQVVHGNADFQGQQVNDALKDVGHGVSNITEALGRLQNRTPALVRQVAKAGRTRQARKKYKLTTAGVTAVRAMLNPRTEDAE